MLNFKLATAYLEHKHYAAASTYFLRTAEWADLDTEKDIIYEALLNIALCFKALGNRKFTEEGWLLHAISLCPDRPEAMWLLSNTYEDQGKWQEANMISSIGLTLTKNAKPLLLDIGYKGDYVLGYSQVHSAWYASKLKEARRLLFSLPDRFDLDEDYLELLQKDINSVGDGAQQGVFKYTKDNYSKLRYKFTDSNSIDTNYSQIYQDLFVLSALDGKKGGFYLEIGSSHPTINNNTYLLETKFNWSGISIDNNKEIVEVFRNNRRNPVFCKDASITNYTKLLKDNNAPEVIDYLQIDCEPAFISYKILTLIPFNKYKFKVITFEHDYTADVRRQVKELSRKYLTGLGYVLVVDSLGILPGFEFEDWWVHPDYVDATTIEKLKSITGKPKLAENYMLPNEEDISGLFNNFKWDPLRINDINNIYSEVVRERVYDYWRGFQANDVVVDIGASVGPVSKLALHKKANKVICVEPSISLCNSIKDNLKEYENYFIINKAIATSKDNVDIFVDEPFDIISFKELTKDIPYINYLKIDCEGGEYSIFTEENLKYLLNNVEFIAAEFHLRNDNRESFRYFRDNILNKFKNYQIRSCIYQNINRGTVIDLNSYIQEEDFINNYSYEFMIYFWNK